MENGFPPNINRYLNNLQGKQRQEVINQISQLQPKDLQQLELKLKAQFEYQSFNSFSKPDYMALNGANEEEYEMKKGGYLRMLQKGDITPPINSNGVNRMTMYDENSQPSYYVDEPTQYSREIATQQNVPIERYAQPFVNDLMPVNNQVSPPQNTPQNNNSNSSLPIIIATSSAAPVKPSTESEVSVKDMKKILSKADKVRVLQQKLRDSGVTDDKGKLIEVDGIFGEKTKQAVINFQKTNGLDTDGVVGAKTKVKLGLTNLGKDVLRPIGYRPPLDIPKEKDNTTLSKSMTSVIEDLKNQKNSFTKINNPTIPPVPPTPPKLEIDWNNSAVKRYAPILDRFSKMDKKEAILKLNAYRKGRPSDLDSETWNKLIDAYLNVAKNKPDYEPLFDITSNNYYGI